MCSADGKCTENVSKSSEPQVPQGHGAAVAGGLAAEGTPSPRLARHALLASDLEVPEWWQPLFEQSARGSIFVSPKWLQAWLHAYGADFKKTWICWHDHGTVVGGCLLLERFVRVGGVSMWTLFFNATGKSRPAMPLAEYNDVLYRAGFEAAIAVDLAELLRGMPWQRIELSGYEKGGVLDRTLPLLPMAAVDSAVEHARYLDLRDLPDRPFEDSLKGRNGSHLRRNRKLFEARLGPVSLTAARSADEALEFFEELVRLHRLRWQARGVATSLASPTVLAFHRSLIDRLWPLGAVDLIRVGSATRAVGFLYNFVWRGRVCFFQSGFHYENDSRLSPGMLTLTAAIEHYRRCGAEEFDFLAGEGLYKRRLAKQVRELTWSVVYRRTLAVRIFLAVRACKRYLALRLLGHP